MNALSNRVYCPHCGDIFRRSQWFIKGEHLPVWRCVSRLEKRKADAKCPSRTLYETELQKAVVTAINLMIAQKDELLPGMKLAMENALVNSNAEEIDRIDSQLEALEKEMLQKQMPGRTSMTSQGRSTTFMRPNYGSSWRTQTGPG